MTLTPMQAPAQSFRQCQAGRPRHGLAGPAQHRAGSVELGLNQGTEVEGEAEVVAAAVDLVDDLNAARPAVEPDRTPMADGRVERGIAVMLCGPAGDLHPVDSIDLPRTCMTQPEEGTADGRLIPPVQLDGIMRDRRTEVSAPREITVVAIGAWISENVYAAITDLHG